MFHNCICYAFLSVPCSLLITCLERADLLALLCVLFSCVIFPYAGFPQALEIMENLENHKKVPCMEKIVEFETT